MEDFAPESLLAIIMGKEGIRCLTSCNDEAAGEQGSLSLGLGVKHCKLPSTFSSVHMLSNRDLGVKTDKLGYAKLGGVCLEIRVEDTARDVLVLHNAKGLGIHGKIRILVSAQKVVALESWIDAFIPPSATDAGLLLEDHEGAVWVEASELFSSPKTVPACVGDEIC